MECVQDKNVRPLAIWCQTGSAKTSAFALMQAAVGSVGGCKATKMLPVSLGMVSQVGLHFAEDTLFFCGHVQLRNINVDRYFRRLSHGRGSLIE